MLIELFQITGYRQIQEGGFNFNFQTTQIRGFYDTENTTVADESTGGITYTYESLPALTAGQSVSGDYQKYDIPGDTTKAELPSGWVLNLNLLYNDGAGNIWRINFERIPGDYFFVRQDSVLQADGVPTTLQDIMIENCLCVNDDGNGIGEVVINVRNRNLPTQFSINGGSTWQASNTFTGLDAGVYLATVKDVLDNITSQNFEIRLTPFYAEKYRIEFYDNEGQFLRIIFLKKDYLEGIESYLTATDDPLIITRGKRGGEIYDILHGSEIKISFWCITTDFQFLEFHTSDEREWKVSVEYVGSKLPLEYYYIVPDFYQEQYICLPYQIELVGTDLLGTLKKFPFIQYNDIPYYGKLTAMQIILECIKKLDLSSSLIRFLNSLAFNSENYTTNLDYDYYNVFNDLKLNTADFKGMSCYDVLQAILEPFMCRIFLENGYINIISTYDITQYQQDRNMTDMILGEIITVTSTTAGTVQFDPGSGVVTKPYIDGTLSIRDVTLVAGDLVYLAYDANGGNPATGLVYYMVKKFREIATGLHYMSTGALSSATPIDVLQPLREITAASAADKVVWLNQTQLMEIRPPFKSINVMTEQEISAPIILNFDLSEWDSLGNPKYWDIVQNTTDDSGDNISITKLSDKNETIALIGGYVSEAQGIAMAGQLISMPVVIDSYSASDYTFKFSMEYKVNVTVTGFIYIQILCIENNILYYLTNNAGVYEWDSNVQYIALPFATGNQVDKWQKFEINNIVLDVTIATANKPHEVFFRCFQIICDGVQTANGYFIKNLIFERNPFDEENLTFTNKQTSGVYSYVPDDFNLQLHDTNMSLTQRSIEKNILYDKQGFPIESWGESNFKLLQISANLIWYNHNLKRQVLSGTLYCDTRLKFWDILHYSGQDSKYYLITYLEYNAKKCENTIEAIELLQLNPDVPAYDYFNHIIQETGYKILLEDNSSYLILEA